MATLRLRIASTGMKERRGCDIEGSKVKETKGAKE